MIEKYNSCILRCDSILASGQAVGRYEILSWPRDERLLPTYYDAPQSCAFYAPTYGSSPKKTKPFKTSECRCDAIREREFVRRAQEAILCRKNTPNHTSRSQMNKLLAL